MKKTAPKPLKKLKVKARLSVEAALYAQENLKPIFEKMVELAESDDAKMSDLTTAADTLMRAAAHRERVLHAAKLMRNVPAQTIAHQTVNILNYNAEDMTDAEKDVLQKIRLAHLHGKALPVKTDA